MVILDTPVSNTETYKTEYYVREDENHLTGAFLIKRKKNE